ncbi:MAG: GTP-binding protein [Candidatus Helarchaeota archaeon]|nr:GTP-binding protein [Candidatus Helarchaeota archaeon]
MIPEDIQKFLKDVPADLEETEEVLKLPIKHIKDIPPEKQKILVNTLSVKTIFDFANKVLTSSNIHLLKILDIDDIALEKWQAIANYISKLVKGTADLVFNMKILLAGLENAGKTALLNVLTKRFEISNLKPTISMNIAQMTSENVTFAIWDMGGQVRYRDDYIKNPEKYFVGVNILIYVIDVQDKEKYDESKQYLVKILEILETFEEYPECFIFLHKADPQIIEGIQDDLENLEKMVEEIFSSREFQYRTFQSSIYNAVLTSSNIAKSLSNLFSMAKQEEGSPTLLKSLELIYDNFIGFSYLTENKFQNLENRIDNLEAQNRHLISIISKGEAIEVLKEKPLEGMEKPTLPPRAALVQELKQLFRKSRDDSS